MEGDSFSEFISQGPVIRLLLTTAFFAFLWFASLAWISQRAGERRRRRREGLPPLPSLFEQTVNMVNRLASPQSDDRDPQETPTANSPPQESSASSIPLPSMDDLTSGLSNPEPPGPEPASLEAEAPVTTSAADLRSEMLMTDGDEGQDSDVSGVLPLGPEPPRSASGDFVPGSFELPSDAVEVMRIWRDVSDGALVIQMGDHLFQTVSEMRDRGMARRFIRLVEDLARLARAGAQAASLPPPNFEARSAIISEQGSWASKSPAQNDTPLPISTSLPDPALVQANKLEPTSAEQTIAEQIEELLQYRIMQTPIFKHRSIHVRSNFDGSLRIDVDGRLYEHVDEVVDVDVREFLQNIIREWEARQ
ncbi:MAG: hypothetical protein GYB66_06535 [Chloroflexi bacterium]|nr:hypothetical protein [Chloroflexota bacterium]